MYKSPRGFDIKEGERVQFVAVTGEKGEGRYAMTKDSTGSHLIQEVYTYDGKRADYVWASEMEALADRSELYAF